MKQKYVYYSRSMFGICDGIMLNDDGFCEVENLIGIEGNKPAYSLQHWCEDESLVTEITEAQYNSLLAGFQKINKLIELQRQTAFILAKSENQ